MTFDELARLTGLKARTLHNVSCGNNRCRKTRSKIEAALGVPMQSPSETTQPAGNVPPTSAKAANNIAAGDARRQSKFTV